MKLSRKIARYSVAGVVGIAAAGPCVAETTTGSQLMSPEEFAEHREKMRTLGPEERAAYRAEHHEEMRKRAEAQGISIPEEPPAVGMGREMPPPPPPPPAAAGAGWALMSPEEFAEHREKMRSLGPEEQAAYRAEQHEAMRKRAEAQGISIPDEPPPVGMGRGAPPQPPAPAGSGRELMSPEEFAEHREKMRTLGPEERAAYRAEQHEEMRKRAEVQGISIPDEPPPVGMGRGVPPQPPAPAGTGRELMSPEEFAEHREKMRSLGPEEQAAYRAEQHEAMRKRAEAQGISIPDEPPAAGPGRGVPVKPFVPPGPGRELMSPEEFAEHREKMWSLGPEERAAYRAEHHEEMRKRAEAQGLSIPDQPPARGMGPGMRPHMGRRMGPPPGYLYEYEWVDPDYRGWGGPGWRGTPYGYGRPGGWGW
ncbi:MAG: hypothetical protein ABFS23_05815 [Pseudomonadota bacterium]